MPDRFVRLTEEEREYSEKRAAMKAKYKSETPYEIGLRLKEAEEAQKVA